MKKKKKKLLEIIPIQENGSYKVKKAKNAIKKRKKRNKKDCR